MNTVINYHVAQAIKLLVAGKFGSGEMAPAKAWSYGAHRVQEAYPNALVAYTEEFDRCLAVVNR